MITNELKKELLKIPLQELIKIYEEEKARTKSNAEKRYTLGRLDVNVGVSATNQSRVIIEYSISVPEGILCYVKGNTSDNAELLIREINEVISKYQK